MIESDRNRVVVVLGMHRSGTSAITRALKVLGVDVGEKLMPAAPGDNEKGFWEDLDIYELNVRLMEAIGDDWDALTPFMYENICESMIRDHQESAVKILQDRFKSTILFGMKDPRIARLLPFWKSVFECMTLEVNYIIACRNPLSVAKSLKKRNGFDARKSMYLWLEDTLYSLLYSAGSKRVVVDYDSLIEDPASQLKRLAEYLDLQFDSESRQFVDYRDEFLDDELRHARFQLADILENEVVPSQVVDLYSNLQKLAKDCINFEESSFSLMLEKIRAQLSDIRPALEYMQVCNASIYHLTQELDERDCKISNLNQILNERDGQITELIQTINKRDNEVSSLKQVVSERESLVVEQESRMVDEVHARTEAEFKYAEATARISAMERSRSWRITVPYRWIGTEIKKPLRRLAATGLLSRAVVAALLLPAAYVQYGSIYRSLRELRSGPGAAAKVIVAQYSIRDRMLARQRVVRRFVFLCFSTAVLVQRSGSVIRSIRKSARVLHAEGFTGIRSRLISTAPGFVAQPLDATSRQPAVLCELKREIAGRILVVDYRVPRGDVSAGERAMIGIMQDLRSLGYEVVFLPNDMLSSPQYEQILHDIGVIVVTRESGFESSIQYINRHGEEFGAVFISRINVAEPILPIIRGVAPDARVIFHAPDLQFLREMREAELDNDPVSRQSAIETRYHELSIMSQSDLVVLISPVEAQVIREVLPNAPISIFQGLYAPVIIGSRPYVQRRNIFFLGGFGHKPNVDAVEWFATEIWPHVYKALPHVEFHIIGAEVPASIMSLGKMPGVKVVGYVHELEPVLQSLRVGVAPLRYGAGIKGKIAVTMGAGIPCVCTEIATEGMGIKNNVHALVENDPVCFARAVVLLYQDEEKWARLAKNGQALVRDKFSDAANRASLLRMLNQAMALPISLFYDYCKSTNPLPVPNPDAVETVDVSIIIPAYNKWDLTRSCLTSVVQTCLGSGVTFEVILADDGSTDETVRSAEIFPGLRVVKASSNLGFLRNCNNAAKHARGRHILLLNNDTVVLPGWLESLYQTIESDLAIAIVGSKMLYPDGLIQEAGAALFNNGTAINIGRGHRRFTEVFNIRREVDYISGSSILIRRSFWESVGGFDERYKNAYCEDSDLAMTARSVGMRVVYEPASEVIHFEHQSYAEQAPSHNATLQNHNIAILLNKWQNVFQRDYLPVSEWQLAASNAERSVPGSALSRRITGKLNILYFSPFPSHPASHGNRSTILQFGQRFQSFGHEVHFVLLQTSEYAPKDLDAMAGTWDSLDVIPYANPLIANGQEIPFDGWYEDGLGERIRVMCDKYDIDIVFCSYVFQSKLLEYVPDYMLKVIDTHDKMGGRYEMLRNNGQPLEFFSCTPEEEGEYLRRADVVVARREEEARYFDAVSGRKTSIVVPHVEEPHFLDRHFGKLRNAGIVASANRINLTIVRETLETIEGYLAGESCPFTVHIAGQVKDMLDALPEKEKVIFNRSWVCMHGYVPEIAKFYEEMDVVLSPVTMGTGINVKTVQAMAFGMPLLTTACGAKGIETGDPMHTHADLNSLVASIFTLIDTPNELERLAGLSRIRYVEFYEASMAAMRNIFLDSKLNTTPSEFDNSKYEANMG